MFRPGRFESKFTRKRISVPQVASPDSKLSYWAEQPFAVDQFEQQTEKLLNRYSNIRSLSLADLKDHYNEIKTLTLAIDQGKKPQLTRVGVNRGLPQARVDEFKSRLNVLSGKLRGRLGAIKEMNRERGLPFFEDMDADEVSRQKDIVMENYYDVISKLRNQSLRPEKKELAELMKKHQEKKMDELGITEAERAAKLDQMIADGLQEAKVNRDASRTLASSVETVTGDQAPDELVGNIEPSEAPVVTPIEVETDPEFMNNFMAEREAAWEKEKPASLPAESDDPFMDDFMAEREATWDNKATSEGGEEVVVAENQPVEQSVGVAETESNQPEESMDASPLVPPEDFNKMPDWIKALPLESMPEALGIFVESAVAKIEELQKKLKEAPSNNA